MTPRASGHCDLRNMIDRRNITAKAGEDFNACEDFYFSC